MRYNLQSVVAVILACSSAVWALEFGGAAPGPASPRGGGIDKGPAAAAAIFGELPKDCVVHAVGTYAGTTRVDGVELDRSGHQVMQAEVVVNLPDRPVVLVLTAYDPTVWRVGRTARTRLVGVVVSGYHGQALVGIDKQTPHAISSYEKKGGPFRYFLAYEASPRLLAMNDAVKQLVGREIDHFENKPVGGVFHVGERPENATDVIYSDDLKVADYDDAPKAAAGQPAPLPAGQKGLDQLVLEGKLRLATPADIDAWLDKASEKYKRFNADLRISSIMRVGRTYVVLDAVTLPDGLFGAHRADFIIPDGVAFPTGERGHSGFYRMDGTAEGPQARRE
jgi:hypothetical protein